MVQIVFGSRNRKLERKNETHRCSASCTCAWRFGWPWFKQGLKHSFGAQICQHMQHPFIILIIIFKEDLNHPTHWCNSQISKTPSSSCSSWIFICSVHLPLESSQLHLTQLRKWRKVLTLPASTAIRTQHRKMLCNIQAFKCWCADVSSLRGKRTKTGHTHTHTRMYIMFFALQHSLTFLCACQSLLISANGAEWISSWANMRWWCDTVCFSLCRRETDFFFLLKKWTE